MLNRKNAPIPSWNPDLYWANFIVGFVLDVILHFLSKRHHEGKTYGIGRTLMPYYDSLRYPFYDPLQNFNWPTFKSWFYGGLLGGFILVLGLLLSDSLLQFIDWYKKNEEKKRTLN